MRKRIAVIGAGIAGATAARALHERGHSVVVFDKGRGPGGRASTRTEGSWVFDHGAQYFTAKDPRFQAQVNKWRERGVVAEWGAGIYSYDGTLQRAGSNTMRYVGVPGMSSLSRDLLEGLDCRFGTEVKVLPDADQVIVTLPPEQAAALTGVSLEHAMQPVWCVMLGFAQAVNELGGVFVNEGALSWIARNSSKPGRPPHETWVLHATAAWSAAHLDAGDIVTPLFDETQRVLGCALPAPAFAKAHRWRYARPDRSVGLLTYRQGDIHFAGDWLAGGRVEGAFLSGLAAAEQI